MSAKAVRRILFWSSIVAWAIGWSGALMVQSHQLPQKDALGAVGWWGIGAFLGTAWLILKIIQLAARTWNSEKTAAGR